MRTLNPCRSDPFQDIWKKKEEPRKTVKNYSAQSMKVSLTISGIGIILAGAAYGYRAYKKDGELINQLQPISSNCSVALQTVDRLHFSQSREQVLSEIFAKCPLQKVEAASKMDAGEIKDRACQELFHEALKTGQHLNALMHTNQIGEIPLRDRLLKILSHAAPELKEKAFDQMSFIKGERAYETWIRSLVDEGKEREGIELLEKKILHAEAKYHMQHEILYRVRNPDLRAQLAEKLPEGESKDRAYRIVTENYVSLNRCLDALNFAKRVNFNEVEDFFDDLDSRLHSSKFDQIRRSEGRNSELTRAIYAQHDRLDQVAECHEGKFADAATAAKASTASIHIRSMLLGIEIGSEIGLQLFEEDRD